MPENCQNSVVRAEAGENRAIDFEGFIRLTTKEFQESAIDIIKRVMFNGDRFLLQQAGEDVGAIVPEAEFHKLDYWMAEIKPSQFMPEEEEYYADEGAIHCIYPDEVLEDLENILADVKEFDELFGLLPISEMGRDVDIFMPVAILMSADRFWVPEYVIAEKKMILNG
ncbi:MAG: type II toxin-antitoxin system Phd/YefM family antitoxin [Microcoleus sp. CSU_2_2]|nr:type II toxin-antitoxin system Phd/YefM family antitoxin [Microcoleus sp. CSU_2_2]